MRPRKAILICEPDEYFASYLTVLLDTHGFVPVVTHTAAAALEALAKPQTNPYLMICEYILPGMSGEELARRGKKLRLELPAINLGYHGLPVLLLTEHLTGAIAYQHADILMLKRQPISALMERVRCLTARKRGPKGRAA